MKNIKVFIFLTLLFSAPFFMGACASGDVSASNSAEAAFKSAEEYDKDERYEEALQKYAEVKNKHPYSKYAVESELRIADVHYKKEAFLESQTAYQLFKDFHPKHPKMDYVTFRLAMSYFNQIPSTTDRDITSANKAIQYFDEVTSRFPKSEFIAECDKNRNESYRMLAEKEMYIGNFYFIREVWGSALSRYQKLLEKFPNRGFDDEALFKGGVSAYEAGKTDVGHTMLSKVVEKYSAGKYANDAKFALEKYGNNKR